MLRLMECLQSTGSKHVHCTVNHSLYFVDPRDSIELSLIDPATGAHTQGVEGMWSACKRMICEEKTMHSKLFDTYLPEFMWHRKFENLVGRLLLAISLSTSIQCNVLKVNLIGVL